MKKITVYINDQEVELYLTPEGKGFTIHDFQGKNEVLANVSVVDASPEEKALIQLYIEKNP